MNREHAAKLLHDMHLVLTEYGIRHFLIDGTLLGAVREGDFIAHDLDMDIGVFAEDWTAMKLFALTTELQKQGIDLVHQLGDFDKYFELAFRRDGIKIDLFFYRRDGEYRVFHAFRNGGRNLPDDVITYEYNAELIENIKPMYFQNESYPAPADPIAVLEAKYGHEWRTPVTKWDWADGPNNKRSA